MNLPEQIQKVVTSIFIAALITLDSFEKTNATSIADKRILMEAQKGKQMVQSVK